MKPTDSQPVDLQSLLRPAAADLDRVRRRIEEVLGGSAAPVGEMLCQLHLGGGKMLRPALTLLSGQCVGLAGSDHIELGAIVEMIHLASLLHDDVIDQAQVRRKRPSANALWGNTQAVLLGDFVLSKAFGLGAGLELSDAAAILCQTAEAICTGEMRQNLRKGDWDLTEAEYLAIIEGKTASLFGACCHLGALAGRAEPSVCEQLRRYGVALGMAFQMTDDLLDIVGSSREEGKTLGTDFVHEKLTLPVIHWLGQGGGESQKNRLKQLIADAHSEELCAAVVTSGAVDYTLTRAEDYGRQARACLIGLPDSPAKEALSGLVSFVTHRI